jgi:hypothetical protein
MHVEVLVEEPSAEAALRNLLPAILSSQASFQIFRHNGKQDLLSRLPSRLRGYRKFLPRDWRIVVLIDEDRSDCKALKKKLEKIAFDAGLTTKSRARGAAFQVMNRIAVEELESWFFGDPTAIMAAFPKIPEKQFRGARYRDVDSIRGGTAEALEAILQRHRYFPSGMPKIEVARVISRYMEPERNRSRSFQVFRKGILELLSLTAAKRGEES